MAEIPELPETNVSRDSSWRENYCFDGFDSESGINFWFHMGRWSLDPRFWREQIQVHLPDGRSLMRRSYGLRDSQRGPAGAMASFTCLEPTRIWQLQYRGPVRPSTSAELLAAPLRDAPMILLDVDLRFDATSPIWDITGDVGHEKWGNGHYEQAGRATGTITIGREQIAFDGHSFRDHSRGARDMSNFAAHLWIHGTFEDDLGFAMLFTRNRQNGRIVPGLAKTVLFIGNEIVPAECIDPPFLAQHGAPPTHYSLDIRAKGETLRIDAKCHGNLIHSSNAAFESFDGAAPDLAHLIVHKQGAIFERSGIRGIGNTERSISAVSW